MIKLICKKSVHGFIEGEMYYGHFDKDYNFHSVNLKSEEYVCENEEWKEIFDVKH